MNLSQIDTNRIEGRLLIAALSSMTFLPSIHLNKKELDGRSMQPDEILNEVLEVADFIYRDSHLPEDEVAQPTTFLHELTSLINKACKENESDTPDFILAEYIEQSLSAYQNAVKARDKWFGVSMWDKSATEAKWNG